MSDGRPVPVEEFVQAFTAQLDRAQDLLALKARTGRPLTFALRDLAVDLHVFWEPDEKGRMLMRHAGPNEQGASTLHFTFTTITRSMAEENTLSMTADEDPRGLEEVSGAQLTPDTRKRLEWAGVRTVGQLKKISQDADPRSMQTFLGIPALQLQSMLIQASHPHVSGQEVVQAAGARCVRIRGANLTSGEHPTEVLFSGEPVELLEARPSQLLVRPLSHHNEGQIEVRVGGKRALGFYRMTEAQPEMREKAQNGHPPESYRAEVSG